MSERKETLIDNTRSIGIKINKGGAYGVIDKLLSLWSCRYL
jgi:hypothetical protein